MLSFCTQFKMRVPSSQFLIFCITFLFIWNSSGMSSIVAAMSRSMMMFLMTKVATIWYWISLMLSISTLQISFALLKVAHHSHFYVQYLAVLCLFLSVQWMGLSTKNLIIIVQTWLASLSLLLVRYSSHSSVLTFLHLVLL